jgi:hypothetical protein
MPIEHYKLPGISPKYPHVNVLTDEEDATRPLMTLPFIHDCLSAMQAAGIPEEEREAFIRAMLLAILKEAARWVTLATEEPIAPPGKLG